MSDLTVTVWRERADEQGESELHVRIEASGETAEQVRDAVDYINSRREQTPPPGDENGE